MLSLFGVKMNQRYGSIVMLHNLGVIRHTPVNPSGVYQLVLVITHLPACPWDKVMMHKILYGHKNWYLWWY